MLSGSAAIPGSRSEDDPAAGLPGLEMPNGLGDFFEGIRAIDDRREFAGLEQFAQLDQVVVLPLN